VDIDRAAAAAAHPELMFDQEEAQGKPVATGPAFTIDDVIEFHFLLEDDRYIEEFLASSGGS
jgi:hypothetical protein